MPHRTAAPRTARRHCPPGNKLYYTLWSIYRPVRAPSNRSIHEIASAINSSNENKSIEQATALPTLWRLCRAVALLIAPRHQLDAIRPDKNRDVHGGGSLQGEFACEHNSHRGPMINSGRGGGGGHWPLSFRGRLAHRQGEKAHMHFHRACAPIVHK